ncbi:peptidase inhibitor 16, partial [Austrofundulus limnaeus]|uniref:Peptidase inhibitor 16 n=1 Tax=Austrofundulus limnaeus TaxID=52670 RepID=A0A2I4CTT2_AUSLI
MKGRILLFKTHSGRKSSAELQREALRREHTKLHNCNTTALLFSHTHTHTDTHTQTHTHTLDSGPLQDLPPGIVFPIMHQLQGASSPQTAQDGPSTWCLRLRMEPGPGSWSWTLLLLLGLGFLLVPGAWSFLTDEQEELLVELHNYYRGQVSPTASAMLPLKWDSGLKLIAEAYAAKCIWNHNPELEETGENLYAGTGALDLRVAVEKWFMERLYYDFQNNSCDEDKMCGHYTQMVWADTHRVGCAIHSCNSMEGLDWDQRTSFLVCNYYPAGNYEGERPYVEGDWCSRCPENLQKCENNLCVDDDFSEDYNETSSPPQPPEGTSAGPTDAPMEPDPPLVQTEPTEDEHMTPPEPRTTGVWFKGQNILSSTLSPHEEEAGQIEEAGQVKDTELTEEVGQVKGAELTEEVGQV